MLVNASVLWAVAALWSVFAVGALSRALNARSLAGAPPADITRLFGAVDWDRSRDYVVASGRLETLREATLGLLLTGFLLAGGVGWLDTFARGLGLDEPGVGLVFLGALALAQFLTELPFDMASTFGVEARFGFNTATWRVFAADRLKGLALTLALGGAVLFTVLWAFSTLGAWAWLVAWGAVGCVLVALVYLAPVWILPLFNVYTPLPPGPLRQAIEDFVREQGFSLDGVFVMDGSKRSTKANAFFTGLGDKKRISLYDTLLRSLDQDEVLAVLAHEMGHAKLGHQTRGLVLALVKLGALLGLMQIFLLAGGVQAAFGAAVPSVHVGLLLFGIYAQPLSLALSVLANASSRAWERQADAFAARAGLAMALFRALKKLAVTNLANLTPHPLTVWLTATHPPAVERLRALERLAETCGPQSSAQ
ncbi:M48 family metallopeptidase [Fundidesulfovibrio butyratiphilus]